MKNVIIPGVVAGFALFIWAAVSWMVIPWHNATINSMPNGDEIAALVNLWRRSQPVGRRMQGMRLQVLFGQLQVQLGLQHTDPGQLGDQGGIAVGRNRNGLAVAQFGLPAQVFLRFLVRYLRPFEIRLGDFQLKFGHGRLELDQHVVLLHKLALGERDLFNIPVDRGGDIPSSRR